MLNIDPEPGEELCACESCKRLEHEPMSLRVIRSRMHKRMDARAGRAQPAEKRNTDETQGETLRTNGDPSERGGHSDD